MLQISQLQLFGRASRRWIAVAITANPTAWSPAATTPLDTVSNVSGRDIASSRATMREPYCPEGTKEDRSDRSEVENSR